MPDWLKLYQQMPDPLRMLIASAHGYYLRAWRYGRETESLIAEYLEHETWSADQWKKWQEEKLAFVLRRAATKVPYYRERWNERRRHGDKASWGYLENWHILSKETVRSAPTQFVAEDCNINRMYHEHTSGTTGKSLDLWWSHKTVKNWYSIFEARCRLWHDVSRGDRWAILGGQLVIPVQQRQPPFWVWNAGLNQLYMSSYHLAPDLIPTYLDALKRYRITYLWGFSSSLYSLAIEALRLKRMDMQMKVALTNAEPLYDHQREAIATAFNCPVRETYGMAELVTTASECSQGKLHLWPEVGILEVMQNAAPVSTNVTGDLICTGLFNVDMPLIRYAVGDQGSLTDNDKKCSCGRTLPLLQSITGRTDDVLYTLDGRRIGRLAALRGHLPVIETQIIQEALDEIRVRFVPASDYKSKDGQSIIERIQARMGNIHVVLEPISQIPREPNGKFRAVISRVQRQQEDN